MSTTEQRLWPWQWKRAETAGALAAGIIKRLFILGVCIGLPVGTIALMPLAHRLCMDWFGADFWGPLLSYGVRGGMLIAIIFSAVAYLTLAERRFAAFIQLRRGPNRAGWYGFLQPLADALKMFFKEDVVPDHVHKPLYILAPIIIFTPALAVFAVIPFGPGEAYQLAHIDIGFLLILALSSLGVYGIVIGGWASFSKFSLLGGLRAGAQMISYEISLGMSLVGVLIFSGSFDLADIVQSQSGYYFGFFPAWNVIPQFLGFVVFLTAVYAETNRLPFDLPEAEQELVGGYHTEYSSMKFAMFYLGEYINLVTVSALVVIFFFGGWLVPGLENLGLPEAVASVIQITAFLAKMFFFLFLFIWVRWTLPRFRYDQLMALGWKGLIPLALANVVITAVVVGLTSQ